MKISIKIPIKISIKIPITIKPNKKSPKAWNYQVHKIRKEKERKLIPIDCKIFKDFGINRDEKEKKQ